MRENIFSTLDTLDTVYTHIIKALQTYHLYRKICQALSSVWGTHGGTSISIQYASDARSYQKVRNHSIIVLSESSVVVIACLMVTNLEHF